MNDLETVFAMVGEGQIAPSEARQMIDLDALLASMDTRAGVITLLQLQGAGIITREQVHAHLPFNLED